MVGRVDTVEFFESITACKGHCSSSATASLSNALSYSFKESAQYIQFARSLLTFPIFFCQHRLCTFFFLLTITSPRFFSLHDDLMSSEFSGEPARKKGGQITLQQQISSPGLCERECLADRSAGRYTSYQSHEDRLLFSTGPRPRRQEKTGHEQQG